MVKKEGVLKMKKTLKKILFVCVFAVIPFVASAQSR